MSKRARITLNPAPDGDAAQDPEDSAAAPDESGLYDERLATAGRTPAPVAASASNLGKLVKVALAGLALVAAVIILKRRPGG